MPTEPSTTESDYRAAVAARLEEILAEHSAHAAGIHPAAAPAVEALARLTGAGKRLRAVLVWLGWRAAGGAADDPRPVTAGAAFELFQAAALVHDDILDRSDTRRGMPSVHRAFEARHRELGWRHDAEHFGVAAAILAGDVALALSDATFSRALEGSARPERARAEMERMRLEVMLGQYLDVAAEMAPAAADPRGAERAAAAVVEYKAARYSAVHPLAFGGLIAGADDSLVAAFERVSLPFGIAFQLQDDLLGVFGDPGTTGKPAGDDLREGKRTVLIARASALLPAEEGDRLDAELGEPDMTADRVRHWQDRLDAVGARASVAEEVARLSRQAEDALDALADHGVPAAVRDELSALIRAYTVRAA